MKKLILAAVTALTLAAGAANAASRDHNPAPPQSGDQFNVMRGGGG